MANAVLTTKIYFFEDKEVTGVSYSDEFSLPPGAEDIRLGTQIVSGSASALTVKLQQKIGSAFVDLAGASGNTAINSNAAVCAELNEASAPSTGDLRAVVSAVTLYPTVVIPSADIDNAANTFTLIAHGLVSGVKVTLSTDDTVPTGLTEGSDYYIIKVDNDTLKLATSYANALANTAINITSDGVGNQTLTPVPLVISSIVYYS